LAHINIEKGLVNIGEKILTNFEKK